MEQAEEGLTLAGRGAGVGTRHGERRWEAELYRLKGELLLARSAEHDAEAETCFHQALDIARRQQAKSLGAASGHEPEPAVAAAGQA